MSSTSTVRLSISGLGAMSRSYLLSKVLQVSELALHLAVDVQWRLPLPDPPLVARHDELAHLLGEVRIGAGGHRGLLSQELPQFGVDVDRLLPAGALPVGLRLEELANLVLASRARCGAGLVGDLLGKVALVLDRERSLADLPQRVAGAGDEGDERDRDRDEHDDQDHLARAHADREGGHGPRLLRYSWG